MKIKYTQQALIWTLLLWATSIYAQPWHIHIPDIEIPSTQTQVTIPIIVDENLAGKGVTSYTGNINWDSSVIANPAAVQTGTLTEIWGTSGYYQNSPTAGHLLFGQFVASPPLTGNGTLVYLVFDVVGSAGDQTTLAFNMFSLKGQLATTGDGEIAVKGFKLTISILPAGSGTVNKNPDKTAYKANESVKLSASANSGYAFDHWDGDLGGNANPETILMDGDKSVTAIFASTGTKQYTAYKIPPQMIVPTIDGVLNEWTWNYADEESLLVGGEPDLWNIAWTDWSDNLVTWKALWSAVTNRLYVAVRVVDDVRGTFDHNNPAQQPYYPYLDESIEFFTDGDHSGGSYVGRYDIAQQWRVTGENIRNLFNYPTPSASAVYQGNDFITAVHAGSNGNWTCEAAFTIYDDLPDALKILTVGDILGWDVWYNDSDDETFENGKYLRDHQVGWLYAGPAFSNADFFGEMLLGDNFVVTEIVTIPTAPLGPAVGVIGKMLTFTSGGAFSDLGHPVEYQFDWGDGTFSSWGAATATHYFLSSGEKSVRARARCQIHTGIVSGWSEAKLVAISENPTYFFDDFEDGVPDGWLPLTASHWSVVQDENDFSYCLGASGYSELEFSLLDGFIFGNFEFSAEVKTTEDISQKLSANIGVMFGYQDANNYYYLKLCRFEPENKLYRTHNGQTVLLASFNGPTLMNNAYHLLQIIRQGETIKVLLDGLEIMSAPDATFESGKIALASYQCSACFDNVLITAPNKVPRLLNLTQPNGGETWMVGQSHFIRWTSEKYVGNIVISISTTDGISWWALPDGTGKPTPNDGEYAYTPVVENISEYCLIKIVAADNPLANDRSANVFTIKKTSGPEPNISVTPGALNFGSVRVGNFAEKTFTVSNTGTANLNVISTTLEGGTVSQFSIQSGNEFYMLKPGETKAVVVRFNPTDVGSKSTTLRFKTNDPNDNPLDVALTGTGTLDENTLPDHWNFTSKTGNNATVILPVSANPNIEGVPLQNGDYVGVFTPAGLCCGHARWQSGQNLSITIWGNDDLTGTIDGFKNSERIYYRVYRLASAREWTSVAVAYSEGDGLYVTGAFLVLSKFDVSDSKTITLQFEQGWNIFSINVIPLDADIVSIMAPVVNKLRIVKNAGGLTYIPQYGINTIGSLNYKEGYQAYFNESGLLNVMGQEVAPGTAINLAAGWGMISYLPDAPLAAEVALATIEDKLKIAKNNSGQTYIPQYHINTIGQMLPGQGYEVYLTAAASLVYPLGSQFKTTEESNGIVNVRNPVPQHFKFASKTGENAVVVLPQECQPRYSDGNPLETGDEIAVISPDGRCCGAIRWQQTSAALTVWGDNPLTEIADGFQANDAYEFRLWRKSTDCEYPVQIRFQPDAPQTYQRNGFSVLSEFIVNLSGSLSAFDETAVPVDYRLYRNYPNPFNPETVIRFALPQPSRITLCIYNALGQRIRILLEAQQPAGLHQVIWDGRNDASRRVADGIYILRMNTPTFEATQKMLLVK
ncbi:choice-of-anchor D domain-containing protein [candidate division KSB1 bacterium]|nr:choice-of-anchor D domain-containing protein [candidate division KSB1 bacterium]